MLVSLVLFSVAHFLKYVFEKLISALIRSCQFYGIMFLEAIQPLRVHGIQSRCAEQVWEHF